MDSMKTPSGLDKDGVLIVHMDKSTWTGLLLIWEMVHGQSMWTGLEVDWKIVNLAGDSTSSPGPVLV